MSEKIPVLEPVPTTAELKALLSEIFEGKDFEVKRERSDEKGIYLLEAQLKGKDSEGYLVEVMYCRSGNFSETKSIDTRIDIAYFDTNGIPVGGRPLKILSNGKWVDA
jgi:hypothetical protein